MYVCVCAHFSFERALPGIYIFQWKFTLRFSSVCVFFVANSDLSPSLFHAQMLLKSKHVRWIVVTGMHMYMQKKENSSTVCSHRNTGLRLKNALHPHRIHSLGVNLRKNAYNAGKLDANKIESIRTAWDK